MSQRRTARPDRQIAERIAALEGQLLAAECVINALVLSMPKGAGVVVQALHATEILAYADALSDVGASEAAITSFKRHSARAMGLLDCKDDAADAVAPSPSYS